MLCYQYYFESKPLISILFVWSNRERAEVGEGERERAELNSHPTAQMRHTIGLELSGEERKGGDLNLSKP